MGKLRQDPERGTEEWSAKIRKRARTLKRTIDQAYMELAEIIWQVYDTPVNGDPNAPPVFVSWGYDSYITWAREELGLHKKHTERLKAIWHKLEIELSLPKETKKRIAKLGESKVRELIRVLREDNLEQWIEMGEKLTHPELVAAIQKALQDHEKRSQHRAVTGEDEDDEDDSPVPPDDIDEFSWFNLYLSPEQKQNVKDAVERAKKLANSDKRGHAMDLICTDFLATNGFLRADDPKEVLRYLVKLEDLLNKKIIIINPDTKRIEYGLDNLSIVGGVEIDDE